MAKQLFANNATGYLNATITDTATSIVLQSGNGAAFPSPTGGDYFYVTLYDGVSLIEIVKVTTRTTDTLTVVRGQEGTTASAFPSASIVECRATKGTFENLAQKTGDSVTDLTIGTLTLTNDLSVANGGTGASDAATARTNLGLGNVDNTSDATKNSNVATLTNKTLTSPKLDKAQIGVSSTATQNFTLDASAADGTMKLARGNAGATTQDILTVDAAGKVAFPQLINGTGKQQLPGGLLMQWGQASTTSDISFTFPQSFSTLLSLTISIEYTAQNAPEAVVCSTRSVTNSGFIGQARYINGNAGPTVLPSSGNIRYIAIGAA